MGEPYKYTIANFTKSFALVILTGNILANKLVTPDSSPFITLLQGFLINSWVYWIHRLSHLMPDSVFNYHIFSHHNKKLNLPRHFELFFEFYCNISWFLLLILIQYIFNIELVPNLLILFFGLWYSSAHVINLSMIPNDEHKIHHTEVNYNYGPPFMDFVFNTLKVEEGYTNDSQVINGVVIFTVLDLIKYTVAKFIVPSSPE